MKLDQLKKTYSQLSQRELALLAFDATVRRDDKELSAITCCMPKQHCLVNIGVEFNQHVSGLFNLSYIYGLIYWKTLASGLLWVANNEKYFAELVALDAALVTVFKQKNINIESVRSMALCKNVPIEGEEVNQELLEEYTDMFMSFFV
jgi:hypothetical protein